MFSGIVKNIGIIESIEDKGSTKVLTISSPVSDTYSVDQSIAHDGICLTIIELSEGMHKVEAVMETLSKTSFRNIRQGQKVNLETSITLNSLLDGHMVQGHVDTAVKCLKKRDMNGSWQFQFQLPYEFAPLIIPQGSICVNGVSLTVAELLSDSFTVSIIPYTYEHTNFQWLAENDLVNIEFDIIGKYLLRQAWFRNLTE